MPGRLRQVRKLIVLPFHPYAELFPLIEGEAFAELVADVKANDLRERIVVLDGSILDGRNRYRAALAAGLLDEDDGPDRAKYFVRFVPSVDGNPLKYVISKNLQRRHLDESQRAMVAARLANMRQGERTDVAEPSANLPKVSQPAAAKTLSISERALRHAQRVQEHGAPELVRAVERGQLAVSAAEKATRLSPEIQRRIAEEAQAGHANVVRKVIKQETRANRESDLAYKVAALPDRKYSVIIADPEWQFEPWSRDTGLDRSADNHYPTSCLAVIKARDVASIATDDCVLFLWATAPMLPHALIVMAAWGFDYVSNYVWAKDKIGTGYWNRNQHEHLLVGTRGKIPAPAMGTQWSSLQQWPVGEHSAKPEAFLEMIEKYFPTLPKIELNRRGPAREGWSAWGNQAEPEAA
jgi:N6-adenosine-specific RNA methylase IME4